MSIFDIFKRKKPTVKVEVTVVGQKIQADVNLSGKPTEEERQKAQAYRQRMAEKERQMELRDKWLALHVGMALYDDFVNNMDYPDEKRYMDFARIHSELLALIGDKDFEEALAKAKKEYRASHGRVPTAEELRFVCHPSDFVPQKMWTEKWKAYIASYRDYWESQIGSLVRKNAIAKRRAYLVEQMETWLLPKARELCLAESERVLADYLAFNKAELDRKS